MKKYNIVHYTKVLHAQMYICWKYFSWLWNIFQKKTCLQYKEATECKLNQDSLDKTTKYESKAPLRAARVLRKASSNCLLIDAKHIFCTLEGCVHIFWPWWIICFIDSTYWYFLKARANGVLLRWLNELLLPGLAGSHLAGTACIIIQNRRMRALSPKFLRLTSPGEQGSDDYIRPTFTPPRHACFQIITHTNMHSQSQYRWIHVTGQRGTTASISENYTILIKCYATSKDVCIKKTTDLLISERKTFPRLWERLNENIICAKGWENIPWRKNLKQT